MTTPQRRRGVVVPAVTATAFAVLVLALWFGGAKPRPAIPGLPSPGAVTTWGLPVVRLVHDVCAVATVGVLLAAVVLAPGAGRAVMRAAGAWALGWAVSAAVTEVLTLSDFLGLPPGDALRSGALPAFLFHIPQGQAFLTVTLAAAVVAAGSLLPYGPVLRLTLLAVALLAMLPPAYVGHSASAADHNLAVLSLMAHVTAVAMWTGGLYALVAHLRRTPDLVVAVRRFSTLALGCFAAVGVSGTINAWVRLGSIPLLWQTRYGLLVLAKIAALAVLGWFGWRHRRRTIGAFESGGERAPFLRLACGEIAVMAGTLGLAVALGRTPPPPTQAAGPHQHDALGYALPPLTPGALAAEVRLDPIALLLLAAVLAAYLSGVRRLRAAPSGDGGRWPAWRTASWVAGVAVLGYATSGGVAAYAPALFSAHAAQYALLGAVGPALLALGAPVTLWRRVHPGSEPFAGPAGRALSHPVTALVLYALPYPVLYLTDLFGDAQPSLAQRLAAQTVVTVTAVLFLVVAAGADPLPRAITTQVRVWMLAAAAGVRAWAGLVVLVGPPQAPEWYAALGLPWAPDRAADQRLGAVLGTGVTVAVLLGVLALLLVTGRAARRAAAPAPITTTGPGPSSRGR
ncbi:copper resistance D precursor [Microbispora rosea subsp. aerata]|nr:cytochrome c oxidase assembly protein [Microbispora rosea]GGO19853.1 copper resistance D precursor [Microbispora rosea subsp. aerata]GIH57025.1 copper resistance D precursor [Microbispora rosea subsp. aerata]GLJ83482.1 copper resistance D precursor [Microbispora rosea subsp. aerata]